MTPRRKPAPPNGGPLRAVGYIRVSTEEQGQHGVSLAAQHERIGAFCTSRGWACLHIYRDVASGKDAHRPGLQRLLADAATGAFEAVIFTKLDRFSRRMADWIGLQERLSSLGISLVSIGEGYDETTPVGRFIMHVLMAFAQMERETISERIRGTLTYKRLQGLVYGPVPFGFRRVQDRLLPEPKSLKVVQDIFARRKAGATLRGITAALAKRGVPSPHGRPEWSPETIRVILRNAALYGQVMNDVLPGD